MLVSVKISALISEEELDILEKLYMPNGENKYSLEEGKLCEKIVCKTSTNNSLYRFVVLCFKFKHQKTEKKIRNLYDVIEDETKEIESIFTHLSRKVVWKVCELRYKLGFSGPDEYLEIFDKGYHLVKEKMSYQKKDDLIIYDNKSVRIAIYRDRHGAHEPVELQYIPLFRDYYQIELVIKRDGIQRLVDKFDFLDRTPIVLLNINCIKAIELYVFYTYLNRIIGTHDFRTINQTYEAIDNLKYSSEKKDVLKTVIKEIDELGGIEKYLEAVANGSSYTTKKKGTAKIYLSELNRANINPITCKHPQGVKNITSMLSDTVNIDIDKTKKYYRSCQFIDWYRSNILE